MVYYATHSKIKPYSKTIKMQYSFSILLLLLCIITPSLQIVLAISPGEWLDAHNKVRAEVKKVVLPPLKWDPKLEAFAKSYADGVLKANTCDNLVHSNSPYGECLGAGTPDLTVNTCVLGGWAAEKKDYDVKTNTCAAGKVCGHYTQIVWKATLRLGCAKVHCKNGWAYIICSYDPAGNVIGERPY